MSESERIPSLAIKDSERTIKVLEGAGYNYRGHKPYLASEESRKFGLFYRPGAFCINIKDAVASLINEGTILAMDNDYTIHHDRITRLLSEAGLTK